MNASSNYLIRKLKEHSGYDITIGYDIAIVIKKFYMNDEGRKIWFEEDCMPHQHYAKKMITGITLGTPLKSSPMVFVTNMIHDSAFVFDYQWDKIGTSIIPLKQFSKDCFNDVADAILTQLLLQIDAGKNIWIGQQMLFKKNTAYEIMLERDLLDESESKSEQS